MSAGRARLFVAVDLPERVLQRLGRWARRELEDMEQLRVLATSSMHVTLCFLGWRDESEVEALAALTAGQAAQVSELALGEPMWLPARRPRLVAVNVVDGGGQLATLQARLAAALTARAGYRPERRPYRPHVTVARMRGTRLPADRRRALPPPPPETFGDVGLVLYRSRLRPEGATYEVVSRTAL